MPKASPIQTNFNAGEFSPQMKGRVDFDAKYPNALQMCLNCVPMVEGALTRRPGRIYSGAAKYADRATRLGRFKFNDFESYILELGDGYVRFFTNYAPLTNTQAVLGAANNGSGLIRLHVASTVGMYTGNKMVAAGIVGTTEANGSWAITVVDSTHVDLQGSAFVHGYASGGSTITTVEVPVPYTAAEVFDIIGAQRADVIFLAQANHPPARLKRLSATNWVYEVLTFTDGPYLDINSTDTTVTFSDTGPGSVTATFSSITGINNGAGFTSADVGRVIRAQLAGAEWAYGVITARASTTSVTVDLANAFGSAKIVNMDDGPAGLIRVETENPHGLATGDTVVISGVRVSGSPNINGSQTVNVVSPTEVDLQGVSSAGTYTGGGHMAILTTKAWRLGVFTAGSYPTCTVFYQNRLGWGGPALAPQSTFFSVTGAYLSHAPTAYDAAGTVTDSNALNFTLVSDDVQQIQWMSGDAQGLLVGTSDGEWVLTPSTLGGAITPTNINAVQMSNYGSTTVPALRVGNTTIMLQHSLRKLRELTFVYYENRYHAPDLTLLAHHITKGGIYQTALTREPHTIVWMARGDGVLVGMTYEKDNQVLGFHRHQLGANSHGANVRSVEGIDSPDISRDDAWALVERTINGVPAQYIEYSAPYWEKGDNQEDAVFLDCAKVYSGSPTTSVSAPHLAGETVQVYADGAYLPDVTLDDTGAGTITRAASKIVLGYRYNSDFQTLRNNAGAADGTAQGKTQRKNSMTFRLMDTLGFKAGPDFATLSPWGNTYRACSDLLGSKVPLFTGDSRDTWEGDYELEGEGDLICGRWDGPFPGTLLAIMPQQHTMDR